MISPVKNPESLTLGKGWASGNFEALKNFLVVFNLVGILEIIWGSCKGLD